ncbi:uncharacterized protein V6R79_023436 [Siganus canaliculatus]
MRSAALRQSALRLVAALFSEGHEVRAPTPLPPIQCLPHIHSLSPENHVPLSVKQELPSSCYGNSPSIIQTLCEHEAVGSLVNRRDGDVQTLTRPDQTCTGLDWTRLDVSTE